MKINLTDIITKYQIDEAERMGACRGSIKWLRESPTRWCNLRNDQMAWCLAQTPELTKALLEAGADVHAWNDWALSNAVRCGRTEIVKLLLEAGADVHACNDEALRKATYRGHTGIVKLLLKAGADVHAYNNEAFRNAVWMEDLEVVEILQDWIKEHG